MQNYYNTIQFDIFIILVIFYKLIINFVLLSHVRFNINLQKKKNKRLKIIIILLLFRLRAKKTKQFPYRYPC